MKFTWLQVGRRNIKQDNVIQIHECSRYHLRYVSWIISEVMKDTHKERTSLYKLFVVWPQLRNCSANSNVGYITVAD
jgi:hypothetical protein